MHFELDAENPKGPAVACEMTEFDTVEEAMADAGSDLNWNQFVADAGMAHEKVKPVLTELLNTQFPEIIEKGAFFDRVKEADSLKGKVAARGLPTNGRRGPKPGALTTKNTSWHLNDLSAF